MTTLKIGCLAAAGCLTWASTAAAQATDVGASFSAGVKYDSNVARSNTVLANARRVTKGDVLFTPTLNLNLAHGFGAQSVTLQGVAGYVAYRDNKRLNRERIALTASTSRLVGPCRTGGSLFFGRQQSDLEDVITAQETVNVQQRTSVSANAACSIGVGLAPNVSVTHEESTNSASVRASADRQTDIYSAGLGYNRPTLGSLTAFTTYSRTRYEDKLPLVGGLRGREGFESRALGLTFSRQIGARIRGSASVSHSRVETDVPGVKGFSGTTYVVGLTGTPTPRLSWNANLTRSVNPSDRVSGTYSISTGYGVGASYRLNRRVGLNVAARERHLEFGNPNATVLVAGLVVPAFKDETTRQYTGSISYTQNERLSFTLDGSFQQRDSGTPLLDYNSSMVGVTAVVRF